MPPDRRHRRALPVHAVAIAAAAVALVALGSRSSPAAATPAARPAGGVLHVEIVEARPKQPPRTIRFAIALAGDDLSKLSTSSGEVRYQIEARLLPNAKATPTLALELGRLVRGDANREPSEVQISAHARLVANQRTVLGHVEHPDGSRLELAVTLR